MLFVTCVLLMYNDLYFYRFVSCQFISPSGVNSHLITLRCAPKWEGRIRCRQLPSLKFSAPQTAGLCNTFHRTVRMSCNKLKCQHDATR